ncbi:MAG: tetratricopeptide repeat protein [Thermoanaerobaculia bacterium]
MRGENTESGCGPDERRADRAGLLLAALLVLAATAPVTGRPATAATLKAEEVQPGYRQVLATLAAGDEDRALEELFAFETGVLGELPRTGKVESFWRFKLRVIRDLAASQSVEVLVPIAVFHHDAYLYYRERRRPILAAHSRTMAGELAEVYASRAESQDANVFAGWMLTSFGSFHQQSRSVSTSIAVFRRALELDPGNRSALMGIAVSFERRADYERAIQALQQAVHLDRQDAEARLRLALCTARQEESDKDAARVDLERVIAEGTAEPWVRSVAFQELARLHLEEEQTETAEQVIRQGLAELPGDQQLAIQLAAILDARRRPKEALKALEEFETGDWNHVSPRQIYDAWPTEGLAAARDTMRQMMFERLPLIADGLAATPIVDERDS